MTRQARAHILAGDFREWKDKNLQIIIPKKRIHFIKLIDGKSDQYGCIYINEGEVKNSLSPQQYIEFNKYVKVNEIRNEMIVKSDFTDQLKLQSGEDQNLYNELLEKEVWKIYQEKF